MSAEVIQRTDTSGAKVLDLRRVSPVERNFRVIQAFEAIRIEDDFCIISDCDPQHIKQQFDIEMKNRFEWYELKNGPDTWEVLIVKKSK
jgi:uncharacterized protein (DUF2249 family)